MIPSRTPRLLWASLAAEGRVVQVPSGLEIGKYAPDKVNKILGVHFSFRVTGHEDQTLCLAVVSNGGPVLYCSQKAKHTILTLDLITPDLAFSLL